MKPTEAPFVGREVGDQRRLRPCAPVRNLDELLEFLARLQATLGPIKRSSRLTTGEHFLL